MSGKDIGNAIEQTSKAMPKTVSRIDDSLDIIFGCFNNVVLAPLKKISLKYEAKLEAWVKDFEKKASAIPKENIVEAPLSIVGPIFENLKYSIDEDEIQEMFKNLLLSTIDSKYNKLCHVSFVEVIKNLNQIDAKIFTKVYKARQFKTAKIQFVIEGTHKYYSDAMPDIYCPALCDICDPFEVSSSLYNLSRFGLLNIFEYELVDVDYSDIKREDFFKKQLNKYKKIDDSITVRFTKTYFEVSDFGKAFAKTCLKGVKHAS